MQQKKLAHNIIYSIIIQVTSLLTPLITAPYIARVLSAELIGQYSYVLANSSYFVLVEVLGIPLYGMIKIAEIRDDSRKLSILFWEIFLLKTFFMVLWGGIYVLWFFVFGEAELRDLYFVMFLNLIANGIDITWFFNGLEEFKTIAIRNVLFRVFDVLCILLFVKNQDDLLLYALITQGTTLVGYLAAYPLAMRKVKWHGWNEIHLKKHMKPSCIYFVPGLVNTIFSSTDKTILGAVTRNSYEVGVYEQANKICQLCMSAISSISNAILPRVAYLHSNSESNVEAKRILENSIRIAMMAALPVSLGISVISETFVPVFFGEGYEKSALLLKILCFNVLFVALGNFVGQQTLIARGKQKEHNIAISAGALLNIVLNFILVAPLKSAGVSLASAVTGFIVFAFVAWFGRDLFSASRLLVVSWKYLVSAVVMYLAVFKINITANTVMTIVLQIATGVAVYVGMLCILKDDFVCKQFSKLNFMKHNNRG